MSGQGKRFKDAGYTEPKPLIKVNKIPMIQRLLDCFLESWDTTFVMAENHRSTELPALLKQLRPNSRLLFVPEHSKGPAIAIQAALGHLDPDRPVFVSYCDYGMVWDVRKFERFVEDTECDACLVSYRGFHAHYTSSQTYAYARMEADRVVEVKEKGSFTSNRESEFASSGGYYFRNVGLLQKALDHQFRLDLQINHEFYTSLTIEALLRLDSKAEVRVFEIDSFFQWGTPDDLKSFEYWERSYRHLLKQRSTGFVDQVLIPMAGKGSRFTAELAEPKPFIRVDGKPMYQQALSSLPKARKTLVVSLEDHRAHFGGSEEHEFCFLPRTPDGQALSTEAGALKLDPRGDIVVSACDHAIVLSEQKWSRFRSDPDADAAIFTIKGFPQSRHRPNAFSYVRTNLDSEFPIVSEVSVKKPLTLWPETEPLLVGTFWFASRDVLLKGISLLKNKNYTVNGELYLDSIFELLLDERFRVRMIELDGYLGWGDPDTLAQDLYWREVFLSRKLTLRKRFPGTKRD